jgi:hypothetical protein
LTPENTKREFAKLHRKKAKSLNVRVKGREGKMNEMSDATVLLVWNMVAWFVVIAIMFQLDRRLVKAESRLKYFESIVFHAAIYDTETERKVERIKELILP